MPNASSPTIPIASRFAAIGLGLLLATQLVQAQAPFAYRDYELGSSVATVAGRAGVDASKIEVLHQQPALLQDLKWSMPYSDRVGVITTDPAEEMRFSFYNDQLYRIVVDYTRERTAGMTDADLIEAISTTYGAISRQPQKPLSASSQLAFDTGVPVAAWGRADASAILYREPYGTGFRLIVTDTRLDALARTAAARASRLEELGAPARETERLKKEADALRTSQEKARIANKAAFKP
jgi:hypothetical protein